MLAPAFAAVLDQHRASFNARVAEARARQPGFDTSALTQFLQDGVDPLVVAVAALAPRQAAPVVEAAWDIALALCGPGGGAADDRALAAHVLATLACRHAALVAAEPRLVPGALVNAVLHLRAIGARAGQWMDRMGSLAPQLATGGQLQAVGVILAWRAGAAHLREGALTAADALPDGLALAAFGACADGTWAELRAQLAADPWWRAPADTMGERVQEAGAFSGLGGLFDAPPSVRAWPGGFMVQSGARHFLLIADAYGAVLHGATAGEYEVASGSHFPHPVAIDDTTLVVGRRRMALDLPAHGLVACCNASAVAVTSPYTHAIRVLPLA